MDQVSRGLSSQLELTSADFHHHESKPIPGPNSNDSIPAQSIGRIMDGKDGLFGRSPPHLLYRVQFVYDSKTFFIISAQPFDGTNLSSSSMIGGWEGETPALFIFPLWALAYRP